MTKVKLVKAAFVVVGILGVGMLAFGWFYASGLAQIVLMTIGGAAAGGSYAKLFVGDDQPPDLEAMARSANPPL